MLSANLMRQLAQKCSATRYPMGFVCRPFPRPWNGLSAVAMVGAWNAPVVMATHHLTISRGWTCVLAVSLPLASMTLVRATHPLAAATSILIALGSLGSANGAIAIVI